MIALICCVGSVLRDEVSLFRTIWAVMLTVGDNGVSCRSSVALTAHIIADLFQDILFPSCGIWIFMVLWTRYPSDNRSDLRR